MISKNQQVPELKCYQWLCDLSFLTHILSHRNSLNLHFHGVGKFFSNFYDHVKAFQKKLELLQKTIKKGRFISLLGMQEANRRRSQQ